jgi:DNA-binding PadR family transcriptional regulator
MAVSSIRVFILESLESGGPMHGYQLRVLAEQGRIHHWTDITFGAIYAALKRLVRDELVSEVRHERDGSRPERQIVQITDAGRAELRQLQVAQLQSWRLLPDPLDLVLARPASDLKPDLLRHLQERREATAQEAVDYAQRIEDLAEELTDLERLAMQHRLMRLHSEVTFLDHAVCTVPLILEKEQHPHG